MFTRFAPYFGEPGAGIRCRRREGPRAWANAQANTGRARRILPEDREARIQVWHGGMGSYANLRKDTQQQKSQLLELFGEPDDVRWVRLTLLGGEVSSTKLAGWDDDQRTISLKLLNNALPEWGEGSDWLELVVRAETGRDAKNRMRTVGEVAVHAYRRFVDVPLSIVVEGPDGLRLATFPATEFTLSIRKLTKSELDQTQRLAERQSPSGVANWRTWTTADGKYKVEAKFVKFAAGTVTLEKKDRTTVDVKLDVLSEGDQDFVRGRE